MEPTANTVRTTPIHMLTESTSPLAQLRLHQLISPNLPLGAFSYSQGLEWAVECGWVNDEATLFQWLRDQLQGQMQQQELPLLVQFYRASENTDFGKTQYWNNELLAFRETSELRAEEFNRGRAMCQVLMSLGVAKAKENRHILQQCQHAGFAWACVNWAIPLADGLRGFAWSWLENAVLAAVKIVPLGQSSGQKVLFKLCEDIPDVVAKALDVKEKDIGFSAPAVTYASCAHETQYTRLYRS